MTNEQLKEKFVELYGGDEGTIRTFFAPGRVNLIGEHIDYNGGMVFPAALSFGTTMLVRKRDDGVFRFCSTAFPGMKEINGADLSFRKEDDWVNYPKGMIFHLQKRDVQFSGADVLYHGTIPNSSGLSSSASIEVVTGFALMALEGRTIDTIELALIAQEVENQYMDVQSGIMDQFAVAMGKEDHAILLNCDTLEYEHIPFIADGYKLVIGNTNVKRGLVDSEYNTRRAQCEEALSQLKQEHTEVQYLCELTPEQFEASASLITDPIVRNRAEHAIMENGRVYQSVEALKNNDLQTFGELMNASHDSLQTLYEVSCRELDVMVDAARKVNGVLGARMTGAGFGGCTVSLVAEDQVDTFIAEVGAAYERETGIQGEFYVCDIGGGVREI